MTVEFGCIHKGNAVRDMKTERVVLATKRNFARSSSIPRAPSINSIRSVDHNFTGFLPINKFENFRFSNSSEFRRPSNVVRMPQLSDPRTPTPVLQAYFLTAMQKWYVICHEWVVVAGWAYTQNERVEIRVRITHFILISQSWSAYHSCWDHGKNAAKTSSSLLMVVLSSVHHQDKRSNSWKVQNVSDPRTYIVFFEILSNNDLLPRFHLHTLPLFLLHISFDVQLHVVVMWWIWCFSAYRGRLETKNFSYIIEAQIY